MEIVKQFNDFFGEDAHVVIKNNHMEITIGNKTMVIELPTMAGGSSMAPLLKEGNDV